jgi:uncharacterized membrane protein YeaQ/YmgE (transglycosylase-associated protein family)
MGSGCAGIDGAVSATATLRLRRRPKTWWLALLVLAFVVTPLVVRLFPGTPVGLLLAGVVPACLTDVCARVLRAPPVTPEIFGLLAGIVGAYALVLHVGVN